MDFMCIAETLLQGWGDMANVTTSNISRAEQYNQTGASRGKRVLCSPKLLLVLVPPFPLPPTRSISDMAPKCEPLCLFSDRYVVFSVVPPSRELHMFNRCFPDSTSQLSPTPFPIHKYLIV